MAVPTRARIYSCETSKVELADIVVLSREDANRLVDSVWWTITPVSARALDDQLDRRWDWRKNVSDTLNKRALRAVFLRSAEGGIQAAMLYQVGVASILNPGQKAVHIHGLATAPHNRPSLVASPRFRGCGTALLIYAFAVSHDLGMEGRVVLNPAENEDFYLRRGFERTTGENTFGILFEMRAETAQAVLRQRGCFDD